MRSGEPVGEERIQNLFRHYRETGQEPETKIRTKPEVCRYRGKEVEGCKCGAARFICMRIGIAVREYQRPGHPADLVCGTACRMFEIKGEGDGQTRNASMDTTS